MFDIITNYEICEIDQYAIFFLSMYWIPKVTTAFKMIQIWCAIATAGGWWRPVGGSIQSNAVPMGRLRAFYNEVVL